MGTTCKQTESSQRRMKKHTVPEDTVKSTGSTSVSAMKL